MSQCNTSALWMRGTGPKRSMYIQLISGVARNFFSGSGPRWPGCPRLGVRRGGWGGHNACVYLGSAKFFFFGRRPFWLGSLAGWLKPHEPSPWLRPWVRVVIAAQLYGHCKSVGRRASIHNLYLLMCTEGTGRSILHNTIDRCLFLSHSARDHC